MSDNDSTVKCLLDEARDVARMLLAEMREYRDACDEEHGEDPQTDDLEIKFPWLSK